MGVSPQSVLEPTALFSVVFDPPAGRVENFLQEDDAQAFAETYNLISPARKAIVKPSIFDRVYGQLPQFRRSESQRK